MLNDLNEELSDYIKLLRFKSKQSQEDVAEKLNISRNTYMAWEKKPVSLSLDTLVKIGDVFNTDITYFFSQYVAKSNSSLY